MFVWKREKNTRNAVWGIEKQVLAISSWGQKINLSIFVLGGIFVLSIFLRYYGFQQPHGFTFDEGLYSELIAEQLKEDPSNYSTQKAYQSHAAAGNKASSIFRPTII